MPCRAGYSIVGSSQELACTNKVDHHHRDRRRKTIPVKTAVFPDLLYIIIWLRNNKKRIINMQGRRFDAFLSFRW